MKTFSFLLLSSLCILFLSCNKKEAISDKANLSTDNALETIEKEDLKNKDCDDFLNDYEKWMNDLIALFGKYKDRPVDLLKDPAYSKTLNKGGQWTANWLQQPQACLTSPYYQKKFEALQKRIEDKTKEFGIN